MGQELAADSFEPGELIDVTAVSKGKGFSGVMKRHDFKGQPASHGTHRVHRKPGSIGQCATPARVFKGVRMAGQHGRHQGDHAEPQGRPGRPEQQVVLVRGAVPGPNGGVVLIRDAVKSAREGQLMASVTLHSRSGGEAGSVDLADEVFGIEPNVPVMHQVVVAQLAAKRSGTQSTKTRSEVAGGGAKPFKQKGTGRARAGSIRSPMWRGGGVALGPKPRSYDQRTPKKMKRLALRSALSDRAAEDKVIVVEAWDFDAPRTKDAVSALPALGVEGRALVVVRDGDDVAWKSFRNIPHVHVITPGELNTYDVLVSDYIVFTEDTLPTAGGPADASTPTLPRRPEREGRPRRHHPTGREREVLRAARHRRLHVHRGPRRLQARDPRRRPGHLARRQGAQGQHAQPQGQEAAQPPLAHVRSLPDTKRAIVTLAEGSDQIDLFEVK